QTRMLTGLRTSGRALALTPDGTTLLASSGSVIHVWDVATGKLRHEAQGHHSRILDATFSTRGTMLVTVGDDQVAILWDTRTGKAQRRFTGHGYSISAVALSPDGKMLATGGNNDDPSLRLWDTQTGKQLAKLDGHRYLTLLQFSPDGRRLV